MRIKIIILLIVAILSVAGLFYVESRQEFSVQEKNVASEEYWRSQIGARGAKNAYDDITLFINSNDFSKPKAHELIHVFGGALYESEGTKGLSLCRIDFSYGCFHEFLGRAIAGHGLAVVGDLNRVCIDTLGGDAHFCQHGVGHGIQTYFGYKEGDLLEALKVCESLPENDPIGGCRGGIFMEYNFRTMLGAEAHPRISDDIFSPCSNLYGNDQLACHYWLPDWWSRDLQEKDNDPEDILRQMGANCKSMSNGSGGLLETCFMGIGNIAVTISEKFNIGVSELCTFASAESGLAEKCKIGAIR